MEGFPVVVGKAITEQANILILGIGASSYTDGQPLIYADLVSMFDDFTPKFVKKYADVGGKPLKAQEVREGSFPDDSVHSYKIDPKEAEALEEAIRSQKDA